jgi:hypothetical protein
MSTEDGGIKKIVSDCNDYHVTKSLDLPVEMYFSGFKGASAYSSSYRDGYPCIKNTLDMDKNSIVMPYFGYIDVKAHLPRTKNAEEAASKYVSQTIKFFEGYNIRFISPIPQFINALGSGSPNYDFEDRFPQYEEFKHFLNYYVNKSGLEAPISIEDILGVDRLDESYECHECIDCNRPAFINFKLDHLKKEYNRKIVDGIAKLYT